MRLQDHEVLVTVFHVPGCSHCEEMIPRLRSIADHTCVPVMLIDASKNEALAEFFKISVTPTTVLLRKGVLAGKMEGSVDDAQIEAIFQKANAAAKCQI